MRGDKCQLPLDCRSAVCTVHWLVPEFKAGGHEKQGSLRDKIINADVMRCLQSALTFFQRRLWSQDLRGVTWEEGDLSRPEIHGARRALANP